MDTKITVKDAKAHLNALLKALNNFDDSDEFKVEVDDNFGGSYYANLADFGIIKGANGVVYITNLW